MRCILWLDILSTQSSHTFYHGICQLNDRQSLNKNCSHLHMNSLHVLFYAVGSGRNLAQCLAVLTHASYLIAYVVEVGTVYLKLYAFLLKLLLQSKLQAELRRGFRPQILVLINVTGL